MTRGNFVLIEDGKVYVSIQFNGNMQPGYNGKFVYYLLQKLDSKGELKKAVKRFDDLKFGYSYYGTNVTILEEMEDLDFSKDYCSRFNSDYLYIKNADKNPFYITDMDGTSYVINPDEIQIWKCGKYRESDLNELKMSEEDLMEINCKNEDDTEYIYDDESDEVKIIKVVLKDIENYMKGRMTETPFETGGIMYSNGTFSVKYHSVGPEDPNFTYRNIEIFWGNDMDDGFTIKSTENLSLHEIVKMMDDCKKSLSR